MGKDTFFPNKFGYVYNPEVDDYCKRIPFDPPEKYPELVFISRTDKENRIYPMVR